MVYALDLDITPSGVSQIVKLSQYDKTMPQLVINLYNGAQPFTIPTGCTAYIEGTKADKTGFQYTCVITNNAITADITEQMTAFAGRVACEVVLRKSGERKGSANFFLDIEPAALSDDTIVSDSDLPILQQIPETLAECENYANLAHQWATYESDSEEPSATNNSKYWAEKSQEYAVGALHWKGSITFANIPTSGMVTGDLYNITDDFITDNRFTEGAGIECPAGTDIVWGANGKWDLPLSATNATQVKYGNTTVADELNQINSNLSGLILIREVSSNNIYFQTGYNLIQLTPDDITGYVPIGLVGCGVYLVGSESISAFSYSNGKANIACNTPTSGTGTARANVVYLKSLQ